MPNLPRSPYDTRQPYRCPTCQRVLWTRADVNFCKTGHPYKEMRLIAVDGAPDTSPDIVTN
jgi:hypothetical protein